METPPPPPPPPPPSPTPKSSLLCTLPSMHNHRSQSSSRTLSTKSTDSPSTLPRTLPRTPSPNPNNPPTRFIIVGLFDALLNAQARPAQARPAQAPSPVPLVVLEPAQSPSPPPGPASSNPDFVRSAAPSPVAQTQSPTPDPVAAPSIPEFTRSPAPSPSSGAPSQLLRSAAPSPSSATPSEEARVARSDAPPPSSVSVSAEEREGETSSASARGVGAGAGVRCGEDPSARRVLYNNYPAPSGSAPFPASAFHTQNVSFHGPPPQQPSGQPVPSPAHYFASAHAREAVVDGARAAGGAEMQGGELGGEDVLPVREGCGAGEGQQCARAGGACFCEWIEREGWRAAEEGAAMVLSGMAGVEGGGEVGDNAVDGDVPLGGDLPMGGDVSMDGDVPMDGNDDIDEYLAMEGIETATGHTGDGNSYDNIDEAGPAPVGHLSVLPIREPTPDHPNSSISPPPPPPSRLSSANRHQVPVPSNSGDLQLPRPEAVMLERERRFRRLVGVQHPPGCVCGRSWGREGWTWSYCGMHQWIRQQEENWGVEMGTTTPREWDGRELERGRRRFRD